MSRRALATLAALLVASIFSGRHATAYQIFTPNPAGAGGAYTNNSPPTAPPPFVHWDLRQFAGCSIPWSVAYPTGPNPGFDVNLDGSDNNAADQAATLGALTNALATWTAVDPSVISLSMVGAAPAGITGIARDNNNIFSFAPPLAQDDQQCVAVAAAAAGAHHPVVAPGPDGKLTTQARQDDMVVACIVDGGDGNADSSVMGDDVQIVAPGAAVPGACGAIITAGPDGVLNTPVNNMPAGGADDVVAACVVAGPDALANTRANNQGTGGSGALTGLFFNNQTGVIQETDIEFGTLWWSVNPAGVVQPQAIIAGANGTADTVVSGDDAANVAQGTAGLHMWSVTVNPGPNRVIDSAVSGNDTRIATTDIEMVALHELGHAIGIAHPVDGRASDDVQAVMVGAAVPAAGNVVTPGPDGSLGSMPAGDDVVSGGNIVDGGNGVAETTANNAQRMNGTAATDTNNIMNPFFCGGACLTNHALSIDDSTACNWLYTPDLGDAPDACPWPPGAFNKYQTRVHTTTPSGTTLNGVNLFNVGKGPVQLFGFPGPAAPAGRTYSGFQFEWLGAVMDNNAAECEALPVDLFADDGVVVPAPMIPGEVNPVTVTITHTSAPNRYDASDATRHLYFNGYFDFAQDCEFNPGDREIWWEGVPGNDIAFSGNLVDATHTDGVFPGTGTIVLEFDVLVPVDAKPEFYCRFRVDYGEDEGRTQGTSPDLAPATFVAQFGEVEDILCTVTEVEVDEFPETLAEIDLRYPAGSDAPNLIQLTGPTTVHVDLGGIADTDGDGREQVTTEIIAMDLTGDSGLGPITVRRRHPGQHPFGRSTGEIEEVTNATLSTLDLPPFVEDPPGLCADSFFDVFVEVGIPDLGLTLHNHDPKRMEAVIYHKPPRDGDAYTSPRFIPLYDSNEVLVAEMGPGYHMPDPPAQPPEVDIFPDSVVQMDIRTEPVTTGAPNVIELTGPAVVHVDIHHAADTDRNGREQVTTEFKHLELSGETPSLGRVEVRLRPSGEHPFQRSNGEIEELTDHNPGTLDIPPFTTDPPGLAADSFFNMFFEVEVLDLGLKMHNHEPKVVQSTITHKPPAQGDVYFSPVYIPMYNDAELLVGYVGPGWHVPNPEPERPQLDLFPASLAEIDLRFPAGSPTPRIIRLDGPVVVEVDLPGIEDGDGNGRDEVRTEMKSLGLGGFEPSLGEIHVRLRNPGAEPFQRTFGLIEETGNATPGTLDIPPLVAGNGSADSVFNVFVEVSIPSIGLTLHNHDPKVMSAVINNLPPLPGKAYQAPIFIDLFDDDDNLVAELGPGFHIPFPRVPQTNEPGFLVVPLGGGDAEIGGGGGPRRFECSPGGPFGDFMYIAERGSGDLLRTDINGNTTPFAPGFAQPFGMAFGPGAFGDFGDFLYVTEQPGIARVDPGGQPQGFAAIPQAGDPDLPADPTSPYGLEMFLPTTSGSGIVRLDPLGGTAPFSNTTAVELRFAPGGPFGSGLYALGVGSQPPSNCCQPHASPGCSDPQCTAIVCELNPQCCSNGWNPSCAELALELPECQPGCFPGGGTQLSVLQVLPNGAQGQAYGPFPGAGGFDFATGAGWNGDLFVGDQGGVLRVQADGGASPFLGVPGVSDVAFCDCALFVSASDGTTWKVTSQADDADADGVGDACDSCPAQANANQEPVLFASGITLQDPFTIALNVPGPTDVQVLRGDLAGVAGYDVQDVQTVTGAQVFFDTFQPAPGSGVYYLVKFDCAGASWQTGGEGEANRDDVLP